MIEERSLEGSVVVASQVPIEKWGNVIGEAGAAEAICDRLWKIATESPSKGRRGEEDFGPIRPPDYIEPWRLQ
ncbi:MAG: ATP-binding protein [Flavobacteriales bacterium]|nr:ATP-binding protein [Flavobacteriales bacterium]